MRSLIARKSDERDRLTVALANGFAIAMSKEAADEWRRKIGESTSERRPPIGGDMLPLFMAQHPNAIKVH